jgi:hypothetical protein
MLRASSRYLFSGFIEVTLRTRKDGNGYIDFASDAGRNDFVGVFSILHMGMVVGDGSLCFYHRYPNQTFC